MISIEQQRNIRAKKMLNLKKQFDVVIMNPPYQGTSGNKGSGNTLWDKFVLIANDLTKDKGYIAMVHPSLWRKPNHKLQQAMMENYFLYLEIHDEKDGMKIFGAETRYDWYIAQRNCQEKTVVVAQDGKISTVDLAKLPFIPNYGFDLVRRLLAKPGEKKTEIINDRTTYGADKAWVADEKNWKFKHPCVYMVGKSGEPILKWSSTNKKGHFGVPKVIYSSGRPISVGFLVDSEGKYGLTQWASGIVDTKTNLPKIAKALSSKKFREFCAALSMSKLEINTAVLRCFRKDFWREFV